jgi:hypothetical protein
MGESIKTTAEAAEAAAMPTAHVVHTDPNTGSAEMKPLPAGVAGKPVEQKSPAEWAYERMILYIQDFESRLDNDHEVGIGMAGSDAGVLKIEGMGYFSPDIVTFYGSDPSGSRMQLVQHVSQLNVMLLSTPKKAKTGKPNRIGFRLVEDLEKNVKPK